MIATSFDAAHGKFTLTVEPARTKASNKAKLVSLPADPAQDKTDKGGKVYENKLDEKGELTKDDKDDKVRTGCKSKIYKLKMAKDSTWEINLKSNDFDAYLRLEDSSGKQLAEDDDSGGNLDAKIVFKAPKDDTYQIIVTTYDANTTGKYTLTAEQSKKEPAPQQVAFQAAAAPAQDKGDKKVYENKLDEKGELTN